MGESLKDVHNEFKLLKEWVIKCPIEAAMRIGELEKRLSLEMSNSLNERERIMNTSNQSEKEKEILIQKLKDIHITAEAVVHQHNHPQTHRFANTIAKMADKALNYPNGEEIKPKKPPYFDLDD